MQNLIPFLKKHQNLLQKIFLSLVCIEFFSIALKFFLNTEPGWDHNVYCHAITAAQNGLDPYLIKNIHVPFSFTYPALFLPAYQGLCALDNNFYIWLDVAMVLGTVYVLTKYLRSSLLIALPYMFFAFNAVHWNFQSGNLGVFEGFLVALALVGLVHEKWWSSVFLIPMGFLKIVPAALALPVGYYVSPRWQEKVKSWFGFGVGLISIEIINYFYSPELFRSFFYQITGQHVGQHSPANELISDKSNPTIPLFFKNLATLISDKYWGGLFVFFMFALIAFSFWIWKNTIKHEKESLYKACWALLILVLWLPRLKPYSFVLIVIALIPLISRMSRKYAFWILLLTVFHRVINGENHHPWWGFIANNTAVYTLMAVIAMTAIRWKKLQESGDV